MQEYCKANACLVGILQIKCLSCKDLARFLQEYCIVFQDFAINLGFFFRHWRQYRLFIEKQWFFLLTPPSLSSSSTTPPPPPH